MRWGPWCEGAPFQPACGCTGSQLQPQRSVNPLTTRICHFSLNKFEKNLKKCSRIENNILYNFIKKKKRSSLVSVEKIILLLFSVKRFASKKNITKKRWIEK